MKGEDLHFVSLYFSFKRKGKAVNPTTREVLEYQVGRLAQES